MVQGIIDQVEVLGQVAHQVLVQMVQVITDLLDLLEVVRVEVVDVHLVAALEAVGLATQGVVEDNNV
jgi:hypothetical protein